MSIIVCLLFLSYLSSYDINIYNIIILFGYAHFFLALYYLPGKKRFKFSFLTLLIGFLLYKMSINQIVFMNITLLMFLIHMLFDEYFVKERNYFRIIIIIIIFISVFLKLNNWGAFPILSESGNYVNLSALVIYHYLRWYFQDIVIKYFTATALIINLVFLFFGIAIYGNILDLNIKLDHRWFWSFTASHIILTVNFRERKFLSGESVSDHIFNKTNFLSNRFFDFKKD